MFMLTESTRFFLNLTWTSRAKSTLGGHIQNWRSNVYGSLKSASPGGSQLGSKPCKHQSTTTASSISNVPEDSDDLVGGFGDDDFDYLHEREIAVSTKGKVSMIRMILTLCPCLWLKEDEIVEELDIDTIDEEVMEVDEIEVAKMPVAVKTLQATMAKALHTMALVYISWYNVSGQGATLLLTQYMFLYPNPDNINKDETFHSAFAQELLTTAHLSHIIGHADVPALDTDTLAKSGITGALCYDHSLLLNEESSQRTTPHRTHLKGIG
ncbi:hypothetical protein DFH29DRAFT_875728 [Suillus ampliporus]|nr:hypothetical protein DFH29DRAFT_875728 [Suillus ampliporus]